MRRPAPLVSSAHLLIALACVFGGCTCLFGSPAEQMENTYKGHIVELDEIANRVEGPGRDEIKAHAAVFVALHEKLPPAGVERQAQLGSLNQKMHAYSDEARALAQKANAAKNEALKPLLVGRWSGEGITLSISKGYSVEYEKKSGGITKNLTGSLISVDVDEFKVGAMGLGSTFKMSVPPHDDQGVWKMTVDGVELTRQ